MKYCPNCGSPDILAAILPVNEPIPEGTTRLDGCRVCLYWQEAEAIRATIRRYQLKDWRVTRRGQGTCSTIEQQVATAWAH